MKIDNYDAKKPFEPGEYRVVDARELAHLTNRGWFLVQVLEETGQVPPDRDVSWTCAKCGSPNNGYENTCRNYVNGRTCGSGRVPPPVVDLHRFLVRQGVNEAIVEMHKEVEEARARAWDASQDLRKAQEALKTKEQAAAETEGELLRERHDRAIMETQRNETLERLRTLEGDLAKVRKAIGELKWKEIVG